MMTQKDKDKITEITKEFVSGFAGTFDTINGTGWLIVDPLSGYLNSIGIWNKPEQLPANEKHPQVLTLRFKDGELFIPAGGDLKPLSDEAENYMWL